MARNLADLYDATTVAGNTLCTSRADDWDADARRLHADLAAMRVRFPDHA
ncbi:hypothetical protein [Mycolicibacterium mengxianglii]|nr:hypothetical protein [Mycolicibacterium mengxianglii]